MRKTASILVLIFLVPLLFAQPGAASFKVDGLEYEAVAEGQGVTEADAVNNARLSALAVIMKSLDKDKLFSELVMKNPPLTMSFATKEAVKSGAGWKATVTVRVDDESLRIIFNSVYVSTVVNLLDQAEANLGKAESLAEMAKQAEIKTDLGKALSYFWQSRDLCDAGLYLLEPISDATVFSTTGKKKTQDLREILKTVRTSMLAGYERIKSAEKSLAQDESMVSAVSELEKAEKAVIEIEAWLDSINPQLEKLEGTPKETLVTLKNKMDLNLRTLNDQRLALGRIEDAVPKDRDLFLSRIDVARRGIDRSRKFLADSRSLVDREIRSPAIVRAKRAQTAKWVFMHKPTRALSLRLYSPFGIDPGSNEFAFLDTGRFEFNVSSEGAFGKSDGIWIQTSLKKDDAILFQETEEFVKNTGYNQVINLGFYGEKLFGVGFNWDWYRQAAGQAVNKRLSPRVFLGGFQEDSKDVFWLLSASWEVPYQRDVFLASNTLNFGLDGNLRLGKIVDLDAGLSLRARELEEATLYTCFRYSLGAGFRLPAPFLWGLEFAGQVATLAEVEDQEPFTSIYFRFFIEYSL